MKTSSRTLIGFGAAIVALIVITVVLVLTLGQSEPPLLPADSPEGTVQRYLLAVQEKDYAAAYAYMETRDTSDPRYAKEGGGSYEDWLMSARYSGEESWKADLGEVTLSGSTATVEIIINVFRSSGLLDNPVTTHTVTFTLNNQEGNWMILSPWDLYWRY